MWMGWFDRGKSGGEDTGTVMMMWITNVQN